MPMPVATLDTTDPDTWVWHLHRATAPPADYWLEMPAALLRHHTHASVADWVVGRLLQWAPQDLIAVGQQALYQVVVARLQQEPSGAATLIDAITLAAQPRKG
jgi:hypothetical protein